VEAKVAAFDRLLADRNRRLAARSRQIEDAFNASGPEALVDAVQKALATSVYPDGLDGSCAAKYVPEAAELWVEYELPRQDVIPAATAYKYVKTRDQIVPVPRKQAETDRLYEKLIARMALRTLAEAFNAAPVTLVAGIVFNGYVSARDRATGQPVRPLLLSVQAERDAFGKVVLDEPELDPTACLRGYLNAVISPHPWDLEPVKPVLQFDLSRYKFVDEISVVAGLDSRPDLLALKPVEFEHLIRELFEAIGLKSWVTQASKDEGVDGVAVNEDPIVGGLCIIQAKRYSRIVDLESVHALAGVMDDMTPPKASWSPPLGSARPAGISPPATATASSSSKAVNSSTSSASTSASTPSSACPSSRPAGNSTTSPDQPPFRSRDVERIREMHPAAPRTANAHQAATRVSHAYRVTLSCHAYAGGCENFAWKVRNECLAMPRECCIS
jgi:restriction system protein